MACFPLHHSRQQLDYFADFFPTLSRYLSSLWHMDKAAEEAQTLMPHSSEWLQAAACTGAAYFAGKNTAM